MQLRSRKNPVNYSEDGDIPSTSDPSTTTRTTGTKRKRKTEDITPPVQAPAAVAPPAQQPAFMQGVSIEVLQMIFSFMHPSPVTLCRLSCVSKIFHLAADSHPLWRVMAQKAGLSLAVDADEDNVPTVAATTGRKRARTQKKPETWKSLVASKFKVMCTHCCKISARSQLEHIHDWNENAKRQVCIDKCFRQVWNQYLASHPYAEETADNSQRRLTKSDSSGQYQIPMFALGILPHATRMNPYSPMAAPMCLYKHHHLERMRDFLYGGAQGLKDYLQAKKAKAAERVASAEEKRTNRKEKIVDALKRNGITVNDLEKHPDYYEMFGEYVKSGRGRMVDLVERFTLRYPRREAIEHFCDELQFEEGKSMAAAVSYIINGGRDLEQVKEVIRNQKQLRDLADHRTEQANELAKAHGLELNGEWSLMADEYVKNGTNWTGMNLWIKSWAFRTAQQKQREEQVKALIPEEDQLKLAKKFGVYKRFVEHGIGTAEQVKHALDRERSIPQNATSAERKELLKNSLSELGLELRSDSKVCSSFISGFGSRTLEEVLEIMKEMKWFFSNTSYQSDRYVAEDEDDDSSDYSYDSDYSGYHHYGNYFGGRGGRSGRRRYPTIDSTSGKITAIEKLVRASIRDSNFSTRPRSAPESLLPYIEGKFAWELKDKVATIQNEFAKEHPDGTLDQFWEFADNRGGAGLSEMVRKLIDFEAFDPETDYGDLKGNLVYLLRHQETVDLPHP